MRSGGASNGREPVPQLIAPPMVPDLRGVALERTSLSRVGAAQLLRAPRHLPCRKVEMRPHIPCSLEPPTPVIRRDVIVVCLPATGWALNQSAPVVLWVVEADGALLDSPQKCYPSERTQIREGRKLLEVCVTPPAARVYGNRGPWRRGAEKNHISKRSQKSVPSPPVRPWERGTRARPFWGVSPKKPPAGTPRGPGSSRCAPGTRGVKGPQKVGNWTRSGSICAGNRRGRQVYFA